MLAFLASAGPAAAHPHVFIDYAVTVLFDDADVKGIRMSWASEQGLSVIGAVVIVAASSLEMVGAWYRL